ncbi:MAG: hypothetical protein SCM11_08910 [Bacillota bacterium]|nr:hypothetical protein [Bacillota bacterium]
MKEPAWTFIDELQKPLHSQKPAFWEDRPVQDNELSLSGGISVHMDFPDPGDVLQTALTDFKRFCLIMNLTESEQNQAGVMFEIRPGETACFEAFRLVVGPAGLVLEAADTEGIRRGLVYLEDSILAAGAPFLSFGTTEMKPHIRTRLSRCFFGPIKRPPMNRDELEDKVNYYPDEYLNRLAHEGVNALWLTITFRDTIPITTLPGFGRRADIHIPKLQETVDRCARYGIRIFVFFIEPTAFTNERDNPRYLDIRLYEKDYPELIGNRQGQQTGFCPSSELARNFLYEATHTLFQLVPGLGGMIDISVGERFTHCSSWWNGQNNCPRCSVREPSQVLADVLTCLHNGMKDANPKAEFISWPYSQYLLWGDEGTVDAAGHVPENVILQHNFESAGRIEQLGRMRRADDYWLSYTGPSDLYRRCAIQARQNHTRMYAKLQVGCSHEVASVTHVPVPGILYDKYSRMRELGVSGAMQSWYFGNYPSLMTRAAGRLSFEPFPPDRQAFLQQLAKPEWGPHTETVVKAWTLFQEAYAQYPVYHVFGYYAPMHDGPVWPLYLQPVNKPLIANWKFMPEFPVHGDRIGECLQDAFTLDEALLLCARMSRTWQKGLQLLTPIEASFQNDQERLRDINTARALGILFSSGYHILRFYQLRERLADSTGPEALACLEQMSRIAIHEIENSKKLADCCLVDPALGFNSEHEGYRFYPEKLKNRIAQLKNMLEQDLPGLKQRIQKGMIPFPAWTGQEPDRPVYQMSSADINWSAIQPEALNTPDGQSQTFFRACHDELQIMLAISYSGEAKPVKVRFFPQRLWPERTYLFDPMTGKTTLEIRDRERPAQILSELETEISQTGAVDLPQPKETTVLIRMPIDELQRPASCRYSPLRFNLMAGEKHQTCWVRREPIAPRLAQSPVNPDEYGWLYFKD